MNCTVLVDAAVTVSTLYTRRPLECINNMFSYSIMLLGNSLICVHSSMVLRGEYEEGVLSEGVKKSQGRAFLCFRKDVVDPHVCV